MILRDARAYLWDIQKAADAVGCIPDARDIIAFPSVLIHDYAAIDHTRVWRIAQPSLPGLRACAPY